MSLTPLSHSTCLTEAMLASKSQLHQLMSVQQAHLLERTKRCHADLERLNAEKSQKESSQKETLPWSSFNHVTNLMSATLTLAAGAATGGSSIGIMLCTAGATKLFIEGSALFSLNERTSAYLAKGDEEQEARLLSYFDKATFTLTLASTLVTAALGNCVDLLGKTGIALQQSTALANAISTVGKSLSDKERLQLEALLKEMEGSRTMCSAQAKKYSSDMEALNDLLTQIMGSSIKEEFEQERKMILAILRGVK